MGVEEREASLEYGVEPHEVLQAPPLTEIRGGLTRGDKGVAVELSRIRANSVAASRRDSDWTLAILLSETHFSDDDTENPLGIH